MLIKVKFDNDVRRVEVEGNPPSFKDLRATVRKLFAASAALPERFVLKYLDDENDEISLTSDKELVEALNFLVPGQPRSFLRLSVHAPPAPAAVATTTPATATRPVNEGAVHEGVVCDGCNEPIKGIRFKCGMCPNFDFCVACEGVVAHDESHIFVKIRSPVSPFGYSHRPLLRDPHKPPHWMRHGGPGGRHGGGPGGGCHGRWARNFGFNPESVSNNNNSTDAAEKAESTTDSGAAATFEAHWKAWAEACSAAGAGGAPHHPPGFPHRGHGHPGPHPRFGGRWGHHHGGRGGAFARQQQNGDNSAAEATLSSRFVADVTIPDGTAVVAGAAFEKVWRMSNDGTTAWPEGTALVHVRGETLGVEDSVTLEKIVAPGDEVDIKVAMKAPDNGRLGRAVSVWRLVAPAGFRFGHRIWTDVNIVDPTPVVAEETVAVEEPVAEETAVTAPEADVIAKQPEEQVSVAEETAVVVATPEAPAPASLPTPTPSAPVATDPMASALEALAAMGFKDEAANRKALSRRNGDVVRAVHDLLQPTPLNNKKNIRCMQLK